MFRYAGIVAIALALSVAGGIGLGNRSPQAPPQTIAAAPPAVQPGNGQDLDGAIVAMQEILRRAPGDYPTWANLSIAYVEQGRLTGVPSYYEKAEDAAARSLEVQPDDNFGALAARAAIASARHDFDVALDLADQALAINPLHLSALAVRVDALTELGRYDEQLAALRVADRRQPSTAIAARYSYAFELRGDQPRAAAILRDASAVASSGDRAYLMTLLADIQRRRGRLAAAADALEAAREASPDYLPAVVSLARLRTAQGDIDGALSAWRTVVARQPLPEYLVELGELYTHLDQPTEARQQFDVVDATVKLLEAGGVDTDLEAALYEADHGSAPLAVRLARAEWERRKSIHVADALAWSLHQVGRDREALTLARQATRLGTEDAKFWLHRGAIEAALGMSSEARAHLRRGLAADPGHSLWQRDRARALLAEIATER